MPAKRIGNYLVDREIGAGGMAAVHLGRLIGAGGFGRPVAVKRLHRHLARDPDFRQMFLDEARIAARVVHPNVVSTLDFVAHDDELLLVMEVVHGISLAQVLATCARRGERMPVPIACTVAAGILAGLRAAHEATDEAGKNLALVHRDVSPHNVLVDVEGTVKVVDFGIARARGRARETGGGELRGKLGYMPPEQLRGEALDPRTDLYAVGVVLWEMLVGRALRTGDAAAVLFDTLERVPALPSAENDRVSPALDAVVARALSRNREDRHPSAVDMADALSIAQPLLRRRDVANWIRERESASLDRLTLWIAALEEIEEPVAHLPTHTSTAPIAADDAASAPPRGDAGGVAAPGTRGPGGTDVMPRPVAPGATERMPRRRRRTPWVVAGVCALAIGAAAVSTQSRRRQSVAPLPSAIVDHDAGNRTETSCGGPGQACCGSSCEGDHLACTAGRCIGCADRIFGGDAAAATCARVRGGAVYCWGANEDQVFGLKAYLRSTRPFLLDGVHAPTHLVLSSSAGLFVVDGVLRGWGDPSEGVLGRRPDPNLRVDLPETVDLGLRDVTAVAIHGGGAASGSACAIAGGKVHCWGMNTGGIGGVWSNDDPYQRLEPSHEVPLVKGQRAFHLALGRDTPVCIESENAATCWRHPSIQAAVPVPDESPDLRGEIAVAHARGTPFAGGTTGCLLRDGQPYCWGFNIHCELGSRHVENRLSPRDPFEGRKADFVTLSLGDGHVCGINRAGGVRCWGANASGQSGFDPSEQVLCDPEPIALGSRAVGLVTGTDHTCVLDEHGVVWCFGADSFGQLGTGARAPSLVRIEPLPVALPCAELAR